MSRLRALIGRFLPEGALVLSVLTFGYFVMGQLRNRVLANEFGLGTELDIYYVAFRIPEVALDVLVAAGLTAPFVPIYSALRQEDERAANDFGRTVFTAAVLVMAAAMVALILFAPLVAELVGGDLDAAGRQLYVDLLRINCVGQVLFAASIVVGEVLIANRQIRVLRPRSDHVHRRDRPRHGRGRRQPRDLRARPRGGHRRGGPLHRPGHRIAPDLLSDQAAAPRSHPRLPRVRSADAAADGELPDRPDPAHVLRGPRPRASGPAVRRP